MARPFWVKARPLKKKKNFEKKEEKSSDGH